MRPLSVCPFVPQSAGTVVVLCSGLGAAVRVDSAGVQAVLAPFVRALFAVFVISVRQVWGWARKKARPVTLASTDAFLKVSVLNHCMARSMSSVLMWNNAALGLSMSW